MLIIVGSAAVAEESWPYAPLAESCFSRTTAGFDTESCIGDAARACKLVEENDVTIAGMTICLSQEAAIWDRLLNNEYELAQEFAREQDQQDLEVSPEFAVRSEQLLLAQRAWITFRDKNCDMLSGVWGRGTLGRTEGIRCFLEMTAQRALALRAYRAMHG
ncbi:lysozyme inhibitor LprI family protein [Loktanella agnita]|uniref:lysozyme inhibitor LprI family protein n=1 Tax=Loktanella agnita TaxID=287097 RepID=UPI003986B0EB